MSYQSLLPVAFSCLSGLDSMMIVYRLQKQRSDWAGVRAYRSSLERTAFPELSVRRGMSKRGHNNGMTPVNRSLAGTGERTRSPSGETPDIFIVLSGFATTDLSVSCCLMPLSGAEPMEKRPLSGLSLPRHATARFSRAFTRMLLPLAAANAAEAWERPRVSEKRKENILHWALTLWGLLWRTTGKQRLNMS